MPSPGGAQQKVAIAPPVFPPEAFVDDRQALSLEPLDCLFPARVVVVTGDLSPLDDFAGYRGQSARGKAREGQREEVIWPAWPASPAEEASIAAMPLADLQKYWSKAGNRLRDSAKWMATVLGAAIAAIIGTTPLASLNGHHLQLAAALIGLAGLILLVRGLPGLAHEL